MATKFSQLTMLVFTLPLLVTCKSPGSGIEFLPNMDLFSRVGLQNVAPPRHETGLFIARPNNQLTRYVPGVTKLDHNKIHAFYGHGFSRGSQQKSTPHETMMFDIGGKQVDMVPALLAGGVEVLEFLWDAESDERGLTGILDAEAKIWDSHTSVGERWIDHAGVVHTDDALSVSVADLYHRQFLDVVVNEFPPDLVTNKKIWLVGHSLGTQLTERLAGFIASDIKSGLIDPAFLPERIGALDPFFSMGNEAVKTPGEKVRNIALELMDSIYHQVLKTSVVLRIPGISDFFADRNHGLFKAVGEVVIDPAYLNSGNKLEEIISKHNEARPIWWISVIAGLPPSPERKAVFNLLGVPEPTAHTPYLGSATIDEAKAFAKNPASLRMDAGMKTIWPLDLPLDRFPDPADDGLVKDGSGKTISGIPPDSSTDATDPVSSDTTDAPRPVDLSGEKGSGGGGQEAKPKAGVGR